MALLLGLHLIPLALPDARLWGVNHLLFLPHYFTYGYLILAAIALAYPGTPIGKAGVRVYDQAAVLFEKERTIVWLSAAAASIGAFWLFRMSINLLGDGYSVIHTIGFGEPSVYRWSEAGAIRTVYLLSTLLASDGIVRGQIAYAIASCVSGGATIYFYCQLAFEVTEDRWSRLFTLLMLLSSGSLLLFFGYAENYPVLWPFVVGYVCFAVKHIKGKCGLWLPTLFLLAALYLHLQILFFLISYPVLFFSRGIRYRFYTHHKTLIWSTAIVCGLMGLALFLFQYARALEFRVFFLPPVSGRPATPGYAVISPIHLLDILNESLLLFPLWPLLVICCRRHAATLFKSAQGVFLTAFAMGGLVFMAAIDPTLGMGRDWDLFALVGLGPILVLSSLVNLTGPRIKAYLPVLVFSSFMMITPFIISNLQYQGHVEYLKSLLRLDRVRSKTGLILFRSYYHDIGNSATADSLGHALEQNFPITTAINSALELVQRNKIDQADSLARLIFEADPYSADAYRIRGLVETKRGHFQEAIANLQQAVRLAQWNSYILVALAAAYGKAYETDHMMATLRKAQVLAPNTPQLLKSLAAAFFNSQRYDSAYTYGQKAIMADSLDDYYYFLTGMAAYRMGYSASAKRYLTKYLEADSVSSSSTAAKEMLKHLSQ